MYQEKDIEEEFLVIKVQMGNRNKENLIMEMEYNLQNLIMVVEVVVHKVIIMEV